MASIQIPNLPAVVGLSGAELFEGVQAGASVKISLNQIIAATRGGTPATLPIPVSLGGTGLDTFTIGDIMYASATQEFSKLSDVATGNAIISGGVGAAPSYGKIGLTTHVDGILPVANGGTNQSAALTQYGLIYGDTTTSMASTAAGTSTTLLHGNASGAPTWSAVSLTADVSGVLPVANGGTNISSYTIGDLIAASSSGVLSPIADIATGNALLSGGVGVLPAYGKVTLTGHVSGVLPVANGGTNIATYTIGDILYASTAGVLTPLADVATGNAIISGGVGVAPSYGKIGLTTHVDGILPVANGGTNISSYTTGDILYASASGVLSPLADVATGNVILSGGVTTAPSYGKVGLTTHVSGTLPLANGGTGATSAPAAAAALMGYTATATAGATTTLTNTSSQYQLFTGTLTQTVTLPVTSTLTTGWTFHIVNNSTGNLTVNSSGGNLVCTVISGMTAMVTCIGTTLTTAADWEFGFTDFGSVTGTGSVVLGTGPTITSGVYSGTVGASSPSTGAFTTLSASSTVSGTGFSDYLASPPAIGGTTPSTIRGAPLVSTTVTTDGFSLKAAGTLALAFASNGVVQVTPNATGTFTTTVPPAGTRCTLIVLTSGVTSYTMTFGTGFKTTGTLATGTVSVRYFIFQFISDGTSVIEASRTIAIA